MATENALCIFAVTEGEAPCRRLHRACRTAKSDVGSRPDDVSSNRANVRTGGALLHDAHFLRAHLNDVAVLPGPACRLRSRFKTTLRMPQVLDGEAVSPVSVEATWCRSQWVVQARLRILAPSDDELGLAAKDSLARPKR